MPRVKIKHPDPSAKNKLKLLRLLSEKLIYATRIIPTTDSFAVITRTDEDTDNIFSPNTISLLKEEEFSPVLPPEIKAKRTILLFNTDDHIYSKSEKDITAELLNENNFLNEGIDNVFKIPRTKMIKITLNSSTSARKATETGLLAFNMSIPHYNIKIEEFIPILTCMRCYAIENHPTNKCDKPKTYEICSECAETGHTWRTCHNTTKKCINCNEPHRTLAFKCKKRKEVIEQKRKQTPTNSNKTYSQTVNANTYSAPTQQPFDRDTCAKITSCMLHAHMINAVNPGTYNDEFNRALTLNNLPKINLPPNPPSKQILTMMTNSNNSNTQPQTQQQQGNTQNTSTKQASTSPHIQNTNITQANTLPQTKDIYNTDTNITMEDTQEFVDPEEQMPELEKIKGTDLGLIIIAKKSRGWPMGKELSLKEIEEGIEAGTYKWRFTAKNISEEEVWKSLINNEINLDNCFRVTDDQKYNKIRNGLPSELTPPKHKIARKNSQ